MQQFYIVPADIMESNFPDEFEDGEYPGTYLKLVELENDELDVKDLTITVIQ